MPGLPSFRYALEEQERMTGPGGITRGASVREFPASTGIAGVSMRLEPGGLRELHWHANAAESALVVTGSCRTAIVHPDGSSAVDTFGSGDVWARSASCTGTGHYILNTGDDLCRVLVAFNKGHYQAIDLTAWLSTNPASTLASNLEVPEAIVDKLPRERRFIVPPA